MLSDPTRSAFPFHFGGRSRSVRRIEYIGKAPAAVREEIEIRAQIMDQMSRDELRALATRGLLRWLRQRF